MDGRPSASRQLCKVLCRGIFLKPARQGDPFLARDDVRGHSVYVGPCVLARGERPAVLPVMVLMEKSRGNDNGRRVSMRSRLLPRARRGPRSARRVTARRGRSWRRRGRP